MILFSHSLCFKTQIQRPIMFIMFGFGLGFPWFFAVLLVLVCLLRWVAFRPTVFDPLDPVSVAK